MPGDLECAPRGGGGEAKTSVSLLPDVDKQHLEARCAQPPLENCPMPLTAFLPFPPFCPSPFGGGRAALYSIRATHMKTKPVLTLKVPVEWGSVSRWCRNIAGGVTTVKQRWAVVWREQSPWPHYRPNGGGRWKASWKSKTQSQLLSKTGAWETTGKFRRCASRNTLLRVQSFLQVCGSVKWILRSEARPRTTLTLPESLISKSVLWIPKPLVCLPSLTGYVGGVRLFQSCSISSRTRELLHAIKTTSRAQPLP